MKKVILFSLLLIILISAGCTAQNDEALATQQAMSVQLTVQGGDINALKTQVARPTATCEPCEIPTCAACPTATLAPTATTPTAIPATATSEVKNGAISGSLSYPSEGIPALRIVAMNPLTGVFYWQNTVAGQSFYRFDNLAPASYWILAYTIANPSKDFFAAYSEAVPCGLSTACTDHSLIAVEVKAGQEVQNIDPADWYADPGEWGWPIDPTIKWD
ncbi:MAG: hypothetical protein PHW11_02420 [Anaerolineaceae bacterium]|jgi:hypothetical protein|nr:hypothetical protein [Anaerolineaceae bacterium]MDD4043110.1 hypothetical protein [Anaerolineaceae bacterium]MDD4576986.1 hypothetical protein [Anaerolineaceae bacterium]